MGTIIKHHTGPIVGIASDVQRLQPVSLKPNKLKACAVAMLLATTLVWAQNPPSTKATPADDYSGMYSFLQDGEFIQISVEEGNRVTGFISCFGDADKTSFIDYFFDKAELHDHDIRFSTRKMQGKWFELQGKISRGEGKTRDDEGYYVIKGTLTQHTSDGKPAAKESQVTLRSFPQDIEDEPPNKAGDTGR